MCVRMHIHLAQQQNNKRAFSIILIQFAAFMFSNQASQRDQQALSPPRLSQHPAKGKAQLEAATPSPSSTLAQPEPPQSKKGKYTGCNCSKSQCLKMYCACFAVGRMCDETCLCQSCKNCSDNMERSEAISEIIDRDHLAFSRNSGKEVNETVCNCRKSACQKKYCECFRSGKQCGASCQCEGCKNKDNQPEQGSFQSGKSLKLIKLA